MRRLLLLVALATANPAAAAPVFTNAILTVEIGFGTAPVTIGGSPLNLVSPTFWNFLGYDTTFVTGLTLAAVSLPVPEASAALRVGCVGLGLVLGRGRQRLSRSRGTSRPCSRGLRPAARASGRSA